MPVSYTHLDVYKRQDLPLQALPEGFVPNNSFYRKDHDDAVAVSYTHLDVYKRQM